MVVRVAWWTFCLLVDCAWQALAEALQRNSTITTLRLFCNRIGAEGGKACVGVLRAWWTFCLLVAFAWQALAEALQYNSTLTTLNLELNEISAEDLEARFGEFLLTSLRPALVCQAVAEALKQRFTQAEACLSRFCGERWTGVAPECCRKQTSCQVHLHSFWANPRPIRLQVNSYRDT